MNKRFCCILAIAGLLAVVSGCSLEDGKSGERCNDNKTGLFADDQFSDAEEDDSTSTIISESGYCNESYRYCVENICTKCPKGRLRAKLSEENSSMACVTCEELKTCQTESCKDALKRGCQDMCSDNQLFDYAGHFMHECKYGCNEESNGCQEQPACGLHEILTDDQCQCNEAEHWTGSAGNCTCMTGYQQSGEECVEIPSSNTDTTPDSSTEIICGFGEILNQDGECVCDKSEHWTGNAGACSCDTGYKFMGGKCVEQKTCGTGEKLNETDNSCLCDTAGHWEGTPGSCACIQGYTQTADKCTAPVDCGTGEVYEKQTNSCKCDQVNHWAGTPGNCTCESSDYLLINNNCELRKTCPTGSVLNETTNQCTCDTQNGWQENAPDMCNCQSGFLPVNGVCVKQEICKTGARLNTEKNICECDTGAHWTGSADNCSCEAGYLPIRESCQKEQTCGTGATLNRQTNTCQCNTASHWTGNGTSCSCAFGYKQSGSSCILNKEGEAFTFGKYHYNSSTDSEAIKWTILEVGKQNNKPAYLLLSTYGLYGKAFNSGDSVSESENDKTSWSDSTLRAWLNDSFYKAAFSSTEQKRIWTSGSTKVTLLKICSGSASSLCAFGTSKTFLSTESSRKAKPTPYAKTKTNNDYCGSTYCAWWLNTTKTVDGSYLARNVSQTGSIPSNGNYKLRKLMVRPIIWVITE